jgi:salicylate hydroxylase
LGKTPLHPHLSGRYGFPYWLIHRADYQRLFFDATIAAGVEVKLGSGLAEIDDANITIKLRDSNTLTADLIVGADGIRSKVRRTGIPEQIIEASPSSNCSWRATVPAKLMQADPKVAHLLTDINANCWIGPGRHIMAYPIRQGRRYNLVMSHPTGDAEPGMWNEPGNIQELSDCYSDFDPVIRKVLAKVDSCQNWKVADLPSLPRWVSESGHVVLLGDAAHAMTSFLAQGAAQAIEDGACLAECLDRAKTTKDIPMLMGMYEKIRKPRAERVQQGSRDSSMVWHLPDGPEQERRDQEFKEMGRKAQKDPGGRENGELVKADPNSLSEEEFQPWLFGHDVFEVTRTKLDAFLGAGSLIR